MSREDLDSEVRGVRRFNRFFTRRIGVLREGLLHSPYSLAGARVLIEVSRGGATATDLSRELGLDPGHLSRILAGLEKNGLVDRVRSESDGRRRLLSLTPEGESAVSMLDERSREEVAEMLATLSEGDRRLLLDAMRAIEGILGDEPGGKFKFAEPFFLRQHEPGDMGWVVHRHGALYTREYGWDERFEALVARIVADFAENHDPARERAWIAEMGHEIVGCIFLVKENDEVARLRLLLVEPEARGLGLGERLVEECVRFARRAGYEKLTLWTNDVLHAARHIYHRQGFRLVEEEEHHSFGHDLVGQNWELDLQLSR